MQHDPIPHSVEEADEKCQPDDNEDDHYDHDDLLPEPVQDPPARAVGRRHLPVVPPADFEKASPSEWPMVRTRSGAYGVTHS